MSFASKVALRYLWAKRSEAFITIITVISIIGVAIGVMVLNITMSIMTGFEKELKEKIIGANSHILVKTVTGRVDNWQETSDVIRGFSGIESVSPFTYNQALLNVNGKSVGILLRGILPDSASSYELSKTIERDPEGIKKLFSPPEVEIQNEDGQRERVSLPGIVIGRELMETSGLTEGDIVSILSPGVSSTPLGLVPKFRRFVVASEYHSGLIEYESGIAYVSMPEAQKFFRLGDAVSGLEVRVNDLNESRQIVSGLLERLNQAGGLFIVRDWTEFNPALWRAMNQEKWVYFIVLLLIVLMASFSIISTLIMIVLEKRRDIAVLRTIGASKWDILSIFVLQGTIIGGLGTVFGLILSYVGCKSLQIFKFPLEDKVFPFDTLPVHIEALNFSIVGVCAFAICFLATIYPSLRASSIEPSEMLRNG